MPPHTKTVVAAISAADYQLTRYPAGMFCERSTMTSGQAMRSLMGSSVTELNIHRRC